MIIVTCPSCHQSYRIKESKIKGRGAKITCPKPSCGHKFVVYKDKTNGVPDNVTTLDFRTLDLVWRVRKGIGVTYELHDLATLQSFMQDGKVERWDQISYDNRTWETIDNLGNLEEHFWDIWQRARRGEIAIEYDEDEDEDEADAPTTIVGRGSSLADEIRGALESAATPRPVEREYANEGALIEPPSGPDATETTGEGNSLITAPALMEDMTNQGEEPHSGPRLDGQTKLVAEEAPSMIPMVLVVILLLVAVAAVVAVMTGVIG